MRLSAGIRVWQDSMPTIWVPFTLGGRSAGCNLPYRRALQGPSQQSLCSCNQKAHKAVLRELLAKVPIRHRSVMSFACKFCQFCQHCGAIAGKQPPHTHAFTMPGTYALAGRIITSHVHAQSAVLVEGGPLQVCLALCTPCKAGTTFSWLQFCRQTPMQGRSDRAAVICIEDHIVHCVSAFTAEVASAAMTQL